MEYNLWKSVLLDWVNSTGFLVQNYENLGDTHIDTFFVAFKKQIKSTHIKSENVISFVRDYYKDFYLKLDDKHKVPVGEYVYFYSLFLHFACVLHADTGIQQICNNMVRKNQEMIEKYLDYLFKIGKCERAIVQSAIEEAESLDLAIAHVSPITRSLQSVLSSTSPQTPKSKMLNTWNLENRNLKAQLETERFERGYLEMQLNQCEKKLSKLDEDYKEAMTENNFLKKQIQTLDENDQIQQNAQTEVTVKQLRREINEKEDELLKLTITYNGAKDDIELLKEKLEYAESQIKSLNNKLLDSFSEAETFKNQLDDREKMISYVNNNNKELTDMLKELQSNSKKLDFDSSSSYELLNSTANDLNTSSFCVMEENLANAVVDIRLIDQQRQNMALNESIIRLQNQLTVLQDEATKLYQIVNESGETSVEPPSPNAIFTTVNQKYSELVDKNKDLQQKIESQCSDIALLNEQSGGLQSTIDALNEKLQSEEKKNENLRSQNQNTMVELETVKATLNTCETQKAELNASLIDATSRMEQIQSEKRELIAKHFDELRHIRMELEEKVNAVNITLEAQIKEKNGIQSKLEHVQSELNETMDLLAKHKLDIDEISNALSSVRSEKQSIQENLVKARKEIDEQREKCNDLALGNANLEKNIVTLTEINENNVQKLADYVAKIEGLTSEKAALNENLKLNQSQLGNVSKSLEATQNDLAALNSEKNSLEVQVTQLNSTIDELTQQIASEKEKFSENQTEITQKLSRIQKEKDSIQEKLQQAEVAAVDQRKQFEALAKEKEALTTTVEQYAKDIDGLQDSLTSLQIEKQSIQESLLKAQSDIDEHRQRNESLEQEKVKDQEKIAALTESNTRNEGNMADYVTKIDKIMSDKTALDEHLKFTRSQLEEVTKSLETTQNDLETANNEKNSLESNVSQLIRSIDELTQRLVEEQQQSLDKQTEATEKLASVQKEKNAIQEKLQQAKVAAVDQHKQFETLAEEKEALTTTVEQFTKDIEGLQDSLAKLQNEKRSIQQSLVSSKSDVDEQRNKCETLAEEKTELESKIATLTEMNNNNVDKLVDYEVKLTKIDELTLEKAALDENLKSTQRRLEEVSKSLEAAQRDLATANTEKNSLEGTVDQLSHTINELNQQMVEEKEQFSAKHAEATEKLALIQKEKDSIEEKLQQAEVAAVDQLKQFEFLAQEKEVLTTKVEQYTKDIEGLQSEKQSIQMSLEQAQTKVDEQRKKNETLEQEKMAVEEKIATLIESNNNNEVKLTDYEMKLTKIDELTSEKAALDENLKSAQSKLEKISKGLEAAQKDLVVANTEKNSLVSKVIELNRTIDELTQQIVNGKEQFNEKLTEATWKLTSVQKEKDSIQGKLEQVEATAVDQGMKFDVLVRENEVLTTKIEQYTKDIEGLQDSLNKLQSENKVLLESATNKEQLISLNEQLVRMEKNYNEKMEMWKKERENLIQDVKICRAKLMKEREAHEQKDREYKDMRNGFEEKLEKMKERMKSLYKEEMAKVQDKHEKQLAELVTENRKYADKLIFYDDKTKEFSSQIHALNEEKLMLLKEHEIMKSKLRTYEIGTTLNGGNNTTNASKFFGKITGGNFRMEDEEGELFDNTYLDELKGGALTGRESLTFEEIQRRNSMLPPHLRSSYMPQFTENEPKTNENTFKSLDDSMFSTQSESVRRGPAYKRPGPPTPSKNGGRLSLGGADLPRGDVLREQNGGFERPSIGGNTNKTSKKITPGKLSRIFSSSKLKDEEKENDHQTCGRSTLHQLEKLFFSTSTPRRRNARRSSMPKFDTTTSSFFGLANTSVSKIDSKFTADSKRSSSLSRNLFAQTRRVSQKILCSVDKRAANVDSTPEYEKVHCDSTKLVSSRKSFIKKRSSMLKKRAQQTKTQKEKRLAAYNKFRRMSKVDRAVDETYSIGGGLNSTGATYDLDMGETTYESDILNFQAEMNQCQGPVEIIVQPTEDEIDFEKLCNVRESKCPFEDEKKVSASLLTPSALDSLVASDEKSSPKSLGEGDICSNLSPQSVNSNFSANSTTRVSSHCARTCWIQQKIPKITTYKAEKKSFDNDSQNSTQSHHNTQTSVMTTVKSVHSIVSVAWNDSHVYARCYIISVTILVIALLLALLRA
ncbi:restin homolog isoform X1 [Sitodiplosis mosellana]|uniref:restin homolog isoform X1 n=1 Tax=Sitodiplosis mosellana TaxID=263140 RepID=UPI002443D154|nr:restin homolog isoform X1 [Sitodiplosis mosellana]